jgi:hypothetical protein
MLLRSIPLLLGAILPLAQAALRQHTLTVCPLWPSYDTSLTSLMHRSPTARTTPTELSGLRGSSTVRLLVLTWSGTRATMCQ